MGQIYPMYESTLCCMVVMGGSLSTASTRTWTGHKTHSGSNHHIRLTQALEKMAVEFTLYMVSGSVAKTAPHHF